MYINKKNGKKYIGQSTNIDRRRREHLCWPSPYSRFDMEMKAIGEEQFEFVILEQCSTELLDEREKYWISFYDTINNGYNLTPGGQSYRGEANPGARLTDDEVRQIIILLEEHKLNNREIAERFSVCQNTIDLINRCKTWCHLHDYKENIRNASLAKEERPHSAWGGENGGTVKITEPQALEIIKLLKTDKRSLAQLSRDLNISLNIIYDINRCRTWKYLHNYNKNIRNEYKERGDELYED
jgi:group I intron endonuclease